LKILLAPAEIKRVGGEGKAYCKDNFTFKEFHSLRDRVVKEYGEHIKSSSFEDISKWFGLKREADIKRYVDLDISTAPTLKAIDRYIGVAFDALEYRSLNRVSQIYCEDSVVLFSNLYGVVLGKDLISDYKFKQGESLPNLDVVGEYKKEVKDSLDEFLGDEVVDLRATFYNKIYKPKAKTITYKFLKDGKVVSHYAKYYRGLLVKYMAINSVNSFDELLNLEIDGLRVFEIQEKRNITTVIMQIVG
jgi:cytoplasmic iron level regulating protein YaaA (DUF328/UPF0246 family)